MPLSTGRASESNPNSMQTYIRAIGKGCDGAKCCWMEGNEMKVGSVVEFRLRKEVPKHSPPTQGALAAFISLA